METWIISGMSASHNLFLLCPVISEGFLLWMEEERVTGYLPFTTCVYVGEKHGWMPRILFLNTKSLWVKGTSKVAWIEYLLFSHWMTGLFCFTWKSMSGSQLVSQNLPSQNLKLPGWSYSILLLGFGSLCLG